MSGAGVYTMTEGGLVAAATVPGAQGSQGPTGNTGATGAKGDPGGWVMASGIVPDTSLNTLTTPGLYYRGQVSNPADAADPYVGWTGTLEVIGFYTSAYCFQRAIRQLAGTGMTLPQTYVRGNISGTWGPWRVEPYMGLESQVLTIPTDLNTVIAPGTYFSGTTNAQTAGTNHPVTVAGSLEVLVSAGWVVQRYEIIDDSTGYPQSISYERRRNSSAVWRPWRVIHHQGNIGGGDAIGTGSPEGVLTAPIGTYYTDTAGTNGAWRWLKKTGTGNTGWKVIVGDTGWRDISSLLVNGWAAAATGGGLFIRRLGDSVEVQGALASTAATSQVACTVPSGFRFGTLIGGIGYVPLPSNNGGTGVGILMEYNVSLTAIRSPGSPYSAALIRFAGGGSTTDAWPTVLP